MVERTRPKALQVRVTEQELAILDALAAREGLTVSDWIRRTAREAYRQAFGENAKLPKRRKK